MDRTFYARLPVLEHFSAITDPRHFTPAPPDWHIAVSDVRGSTEAIAAGRYKEVNMAGAASIVALLNLAGDRELPFIFGGDGASVLIPPELLAGAGHALAAVRALIRESFGLELRVGLVPVADVLARGSLIQVARLRVSQHYHQAIFSGGGLACAERLIKDAASAAAYLLPEPTEPAEADLAGLECRWQDIPSRHGETLSLLVMAAPELPADLAGATYREVIAQIEEVYGGEGSYHPLSVAGLQAALSPARLAAESRLRGGAGRLRYLAYLAGIWAQNIGVLLYRRLEILRGRAPWWDAYRSQILRTADYKKYDDTLRMVIAGTPAQRARLTAYLNEQHRRGLLAYGAHVSDRALMTCLVFERMGRQVHFVDGADGGYALAARDLKARLGALRGAAAAADRI